MIFGCSSAVPSAYEHARDVPGMTLCAATTLIQHDLPDLACGWAKSHSGHLGHAHMHGELHWSIQKLYESLPLRKWNDICLTSELFGCLQPTAQPTYSVHFGEHLPSLWDGPGTVINILSTQSPYNIFKWKGINVWDSLKPSLCSNNCSNPQITQKPALCSIPSDRGAIIKFWRYSPLQIHRAIAMH